MENSKLSHLIKRKTCLTNKNRKNKTDSIKRFFSESSNSISDSSQQYGESHKIPQNFDELCINSDNDDSFDLFLPNKIAKIHLRSADHLTGDNDHSGLESYRKEESKPLFETSSCYLTKAPGNIKHSNKLDLKVCPVCLSHFNNLQLHLKWCSRKHNLSLEQLNNAKTLQDKYSLEREQMGLPPLNALVPKTKLNKDTDWRAEEAFQENIEVNGTAFQSIGSNNSSKGKTAQLKWNGKSKKICGRPLLLRRTKEDREKIITEKVAIVLMNNKNVNDFEEKTCILNSEYLTVRRNKELILWNRASLLQKSSELNDFYVFSLFPYIEPKTNQTTVDNQNRTDTVEETPIRKSPSNNLEVSPDGILQLESVSFPNFLPFTNDSPYDNLYMSQTCAEESQILNEDKDRIITNSKGTCGDVYSKHKKMSQDWDAIVGRPDYSDVTVMLSEGRTMCCHSIVLMARSPTILSDLIPDQEERRKLLKWPEISFSVCFALFKYIYTGLTWHLESLSNSDIVLLRELAMLYKITELVDSLNEVSSTIEDRFCPRNKTSLTKSSESPKFKETTEVTANSQCKIIQDNSELFSKSNVIPLKINKDNDVTETITSIHIGSPCNDNSKLGYKMSLSIFPEGQLNSKVKNKSFPSFRSSEIKRKYSDNISVISDPSSDSSSEKKIKLFNSTVIDVRRKSTDDIFEINSDSGPDDEIMRINSEIAIKSSTNNSISEENYKSFLSRNVFEKTDGGEKMDDRVINEEEQTKFHSEEVKKDISSNTLDLTKDVECDNLFGDLSVGYAAKTSSPLFPPEIRNSSSSTTINVDRVFPNTTRKKVSTIQQKRNRINSLEKYFLDDSFSNELDNLPSQLETGPSLRLEKELQVDRKSSDPKNTPLAKDCRAYMSTPSPQIIMSDDVTPLPDYSRMISPELKNELRRYGLKPGLQRNKAKLLLRYIYEQIHPAIEIEKSICLPKHSIELRGESPVESFCQFPRSSQEDDMSDVESYKSHISVCSSLHTEFRE